MSATAKAFSPVFSKTSPKSKPKPIVRGVKLNKNFLNYPLAQDPRTKAKWGRNTEGNWTAALPSDARIQLTLHATVPPELVRCPSALDMNILFQILAEAQHRNSSKVTFPSLVELARRVGLAQDTDNRKRINNSLEYLAEMAVTYSNWHNPHKRKPMRRTLLSPIVALRFPPRSNRIEIKVCPDWLKACSKGYYSSVPLAFSGQAIAQKIELLRLAQISNDPRGEEFSYSLGKQGFFKKLGLNHGGRYRVLANALEQARLWFQEHDGDLEAMTFNGKIVFLIKSPKVPRKSRGSSGYPNPESRGLSVLPLGPKVGGDAGNSNPKKTSHRLDNTGDFSGEETGYDSKVSRKIVKNDSAAAEQEDCVPEELDTKSSGKVVPLHPDYTDVFGSMDTQGWFWLQPNDAEIVDSEP